MVLDVMMLRLGKLYDDCDFSEWELKSCYLTVSGFFKKWELEVTFC